MSFYKWSNNTMNWSNGDTIDSTNFNGNWQAIAPIGSIVAWAKSLTGTPAISEGWIECNGQAITDADSPYNGLNAPDLNGTGALAGKYLKGASTSGTATEAPTHTHLVPYDDWTAVSGNNAGALIIATSSGANIANAKQASNNNNVNAEPPNYTVVQIMRIK